jgi:hypothetical protein
MEEERAMAIGTIKGYVAMLARALVAARADPATRRTPAASREHRVGA